MQSIEITGATGTGPYNVYICDITLSYCFLISGSTSIPPSVYFELPATFPNPSPPPITIGFTETNSLIIKIIDLSTGCEKFIPYYCPSATPTLTPTTTPTATPSNCLCNRIDNTTGLVKLFTYTDCDGIPDTYSSVPPFGTTFVCGKNVSPVSGLIISINGPCVSGTCPPIYTTSTPTNTLTSTPTLSATPTETPSITQSSTQTPTPTESLTPTTTPTNTETPTQTPTTTPTNTETPTQTPTPTLTPTQTEPVGKLFQFGDLFIYMDGNIYIFQNQ